MKKSLRLKALLVTLVGLFLAMSAFAQQIVVKGYVKDTTGEPVIGANVLVKGTTNGTITDFNGNFTLNAPKNATLSVSFVGYQTAEVKAVASVTVTLQDDSQLLNDVVVIGYGSVKKSDLSGSVVAIKAEEMNRGAVTSPQELIQGKVPGLFIAPGDGSPGAGSTIRIRGGASLNASNDPLIVIDGIPTSNDAAPGTPNALATINPNDIETFTVLKDASATAIYGSRASNGVIIITTKKGSQGKVKISYSGSFTAKDAYKRVPTLNAAQFREVMHNQYEGTTQQDAVSQIINRYPDQATDWQDAIYQTGLSTDQNIAISGKTGILPYRVSIGYNNERGTLKTSSYERYTAAVNLNPKFFKEHLSVDINVKGTINNNRFADGGAVGAAAFFDPTKPMYTENGDYHGYWNWQEVPGAVQSIATFNPLSLLYDKDNHGKTNRSLGNIQLDYKIHGLEDLHMNLNMGYDVAKTTGRNFVYPGSIQSTQDTNFTNLGSGNTWNNLRRNHLLDFYLNYNKEIKAIKSHIDVMAGYSWQHFYYANHDITYSNPTDGSEGDKEGYTYSPEEGRYIRDNHYRVPFENYLVSFFGRLNYNFMGRYLLTATLRRDGSSRFSKNNRWGLFPSAALAWTVSDEAFMAGTQDVLSKLKLRLGYGVTGQQEIGDYQYLTTYSFSTNPNTTYLGTTLLKPNGYSPDLKWEQTTTYNLAIDYGFLNNRINGSIEYYQKHTKDLLNTVSAPAGTNFTNQITANVGELKNKGVEFNINAMVVQNKDFTWNLGYNITWNDSKITKLTATYNPEYQGIDAGTNQKHQINEKPNTFYLFQQVYDKDGKAIQNAFVDRDGNGKITEADRYLTGKSPMAKVFMGLSSEFTYRNWDLGFNLRANLGNYVFNSLASGNSTTNNYSGKGFLVNYYKAIYDTGFTQINSTEQGASDYFLENASFLKMDNITLGYSFNKLFANRLSGRISASVQNVFTITKYSGLDPETSAVDGSMWPRPRIFSLGINLNF
ncbi:TonB-dependent receptor [uncultured Bacteroides sp.]|uniref:SusC/RagA family TonB-linked outer membrane protein n=1 Tax=uncultured Bacteroides sp. TaxID=162156 RepID=UPI0025F86A3C|nr:TonB-dependent receptor [uncultured Bacteroides sp.]